MDLKDFGWERKKPEYEKGDYWFDGAFHITEGIEDNLSEEEIMLIYADIRNLVGREGGQDYLQVYIHKERDWKLFLIDQVKRSWLASGEHPKEHNYCTLLFDHEY